MSMSKPSEGAKPTTTPRQPQRRQLPPYRVLLHNDQHNEMLYVVQAIASLTPLPWRDAAMKMLEAHKRGLSLLLTTHQERAELYVQQFARHNLTVSIEPDD